MQNLFQCWINNFKVNLIRSVDKRLTNLYMVIWIFNSRFGETPIYVSSVINFLHSSAHNRHSLAQWLQCTLSYFSHSSAHASQILAHASQGNEQYSPPIAITSDAARHTAAHCLQSSMQRDGTIFSASAFRHCVAQCSHSMAHETQASIQLSTASLIKLIRNLLLS